MLSCAAAFSSRGNSASPPSVALVFNSGKWFAVRLSVIEHRDGLESERARYALCGAVLFLLHLANEGGENADAGLTFLDKAA